MSKFLTEEWANDVRKVVNSDEELMSSVQDADLYVLQTTSDVPDQGLVKYWFAFTEGAFANGLGDPPRPPDATMQLTYNNAVALYKGTVKMQNAMMQGRLKISGNMAKLLQYNKALAPLVPLVGEATSEF